MTTFQSILRTGAVLALATATALMAQGPGRPGGGPGFGFGGGPGLPGLVNHTVTGAPFSANLSVQRQQTLAGGNQIQQQEQATVARDSQGRVRIDATVTRPSSSGNQIRTEITIYDPVAGSIYRLDPQNMTGVQMPVRQNTSGSGPTRTPPTNENVQTTTLGTQTINGVSATGTQVTRTIPAGAIGNTQAIQIVRVTWVSTALQIPVQVTITDPRSGNETMNLTNIVQSAPSASLFTVPSGYTITQGPARGGPRGAFRRPN